jgi:hypothetical protein
LSFGAPGLELAIDDKDARSGARQALHDLRDLPIHRCRRYLGGERPGTRGADVAVAASATVASCDRSTTSDSRGAAGASNKRDGRATPSRRQCCSGKRLLPGVAQKASSSRTYS